MNKSSLLYALIVMLISLVFAGTAIWQTNLNYPQRTNGTLVWAQTVNDGKTPDKIVIHTPEDTITLMLENNLWVVKEADYYYAGSELVNQLFEDFRTSAYHHDQPFEPKQLETNQLTTETGTTITTFANNQELNSIIIGKTSSNNLYRFARPAGQNSIWLISGNYNLPPVTYSWLIQPLFEYPEKLLETISFQDGNISQTASRQDAGLPFFIGDKPTINLNALLERLNFFISSQVLSAQNFDEHAYPHRRTLTLTTFSGMKTTLELFHNDTDGYWLKISLSSTPLSTTGVNAYIRENSFLYDGWFFKIPAANGKLLAHFQIR